MSVWKASVSDVKELPSQVSFHASVPWGVVPYDFALVVSFALWLWVVRELVFVAALVKRCQNTFGYSKTITNLLTSSRELLSSADLIATLAKNVTYVFLRSL